MIIPNTDYPPKSKPDHRTYEQRILASSEAALLVLKEIRYEQQLLRELLSDRRVPEAPTKPKARK